MTKGYLNTTIRVEIKTTLAAVQKKLEELKLKGEDKSPTALRFKVYREIMFETIRGAFSSTMMTADEIVELGIDFDDKR